MATVRTSTYSVGNTPPFVTWTIVRGDTASFKVYVTDDSSPTPVPLTITDWDIKVDFVRQTFAVDGITVTAEENIFTLYPEQGPDDGPGEFIVTLGTKDAVISTVDGESAVTGNGTSVTYNAVNDFVVGQKVYIKNLEPRTASVNASTGNGTIITYTTVADHNFVVGQPVSITGLSIATGSHSHNLSNQIINTVPTSKTFTVTSTLGGTSSGVGTATGTDFNLSNVAITSRTDETFTVASTLKGSSKPDVSGTARGSALSEDLETGDIFDIQLSDPTRVWTVAQGTMTVIEDVTN